MPTSHGTIRWGILATGKIAATFADDLALLPDHTLTAVGSRRPEAAREFAATYGADRAYGSYEELAADPDVDVIYVATPHGRHFEDVMMCFKAGKAVLCEKALTLNLSDSQTLVNEARARGLFFAEAMWMRATPVMRRVQQLVADGTCGRVAQVRAELGFAATADNLRMWDPALGASALLDLGIYPLTFAHLILGVPVSISASGVLSDRGIDINAGATLTYANGAVASIAWTQVASSDNRASISGDQGRIELAPRFHEPTQISMTREGATELIDEPFIGRGYAHEAIEVGECLRAGRTESEVLPLDGTLQIMAQMDTILDQLGVVRFER